MKRVIFIVLGLVAVMAAWAQEAKKLAAGTPIRIQTVEEFKSDRSGDIVGRVVGDVFANDGKTVLIRDNAPVKVHVNIKKNAALGKPGKISIVGASTYSVDGKSIALNTSQMDFKGQGRQGLAHGLAWPCMFLTYGTSLLFLLVKGDQAVVPPQTFIPNAYIDGNYTILVDGDNETQEVVELN